MRKHETGHAKLNLILFSSTIDFFSFFTNYSRGRRKKNVQRTERPSIGLIVVIVYLEGSVCMDV